MSGQGSLINQLEGALATKGLSKRAEMLGQITDLFMHGSGNFSVDQIDLFDDVMSKLVEQIELTARAAFGSRLAKCADAPGKVIRLLAFDDEIEVAAPVLKHSPRLGDAALVENARTKSQAHLLAISERATLAEPVTDVLVDRGNDLVVTGTARNRGAKFVCLWLRDACLAVEGQRRPRTLRLVTPGHPSAATHKAIRASNRYRKAQAGSGRSAACRANPNCGCQCFGRDPVHDARRLK